MVILIVTALTAALWGWMDPTRAFAAALSVLVVSCPCAFALAVPTALTRAVAVLARRGVLVVHTDALERLATARHVLFDKTGTLSTQHLELHSVEPRPGYTRSELLALASALERGSNHPIGQAICVAAAAGPALDATQVENVPGSGITGHVRGHALRLGRAAFALVDDADAPGGGLHDDGSVVLASGRHELGRLQFREFARPQAAATIAALQGQGMHTEILSGDAENRVAAMARAGHRALVVAAHAGAETRATAATARHRRLRSDGRRRHQ